MRPSARDWVTGGYLDSLPWKQLMLLLDGETHPSTSFSGQSHHQIMVTLASRTWQRKPCRFHLCCLLKAVFTSRWCLADVWYEEDLVCRPPRMQFCTNALTAGVPPKKYRLTRAISSLSPRFSLRPQQCLKSRSHISAHPPNLFSHANLQSCYDWILTVQATSQSAVITYNFSTTDATWICWSGILLV